MTREEAIEKLKANLEEFKSQLADLKKELESFENDFVILKEAEEQVAQLNALLDYHSHLEKSLSVSVENIVDLGTRDMVPTFQELFTSFNDCMGDSLSNVSQANNNYMTEFERVGKQIDAAKQEISQKIENKKIEISTCQTNIDYTLRALSDI